MSKDVDVDICLLLEGTYPYVRGGVSSWVHQIISGLPEYTFHLIFLGGHPDFYGEPAYDFPENVVGFEVHYLLSPPGNIKPSSRMGKTKLFRAWGRFFCHISKKRKRQFRTICWVRYQNFSAKRISLA